MTPTKTEQLRHHIARLSDGCGDGGCHFKKPEGMHTNAGCRCMYSRPKQHSAVAIAAMGAELLEIVEAAGNLLTKPEPENPESKAEYERTLEEALRKWRGE